MIFHENRLLTILMKYHAIFVIFEKAAKFENFVCCKLKVALYGLDLEVLTEDSLFKNHTPALTLCLLVSSADNLCNTLSNLIWI